MQAEAAHPGVQVAHAGNILGLRPAEVCSPQSLTHALHALHGRVWCFSSTTGYGSTALLQWESSIQVDGQKLYGFSSSHISLHSHITSGHINPLDFRRLSRPTHQDSGNKEAAFTRVICFECPVLTCQLWHCLLCPINFSSLCSIIVLRLVDSMDASCRATQPPGGIWQPP